MNSAPTIIPRPLHDERATVRALARQTLADLEPASLNTTLPTATLKLFLETLSEALEKPLPPRPAAATGLTDTIGAPNLAYMRARATIEDDC